MTRTMLLMLVVVGCDRPEHAQGFQLQCWQSVVGNRNSLGATHSPTTTTLYSKKREEKAVLLQRALGVDNSTVQAIVTKNPLVLDYNHETLMKHIEWYQNTLDINSSELARLIVVHGLNLRGSIETKETKLAAFQDILGLNAAQVRKIVTRKPNLLSYKLQSLENKVECIAEIFGFDLEKDRQKMGNYFVTAPSVLSLTKEALHAKVDWFREILGVDNDKWIQKKLLQSGGLLCKSTESLEMKRLWLEDRLNLNQQQIARIVRFNPNVLARSIDDKLDPMLRWIQLRFGLCNTSDLAAMVCKMPTILSYTVEANLEPKLAFFANQFMGGDEAKALAALVHDPVLLSYSLEKRLLPRWKQCSELGHSPPLNTLCKYTNYRWEAYLERRRMELESQ